MIFESHQSRVISYIVEQSHSTVEKGGNGSGAEMQGDKIGRREGGNIWRQNREGGGRERGEYIELAIEPPAPLQLCPPDRRHPRAAREQWKLPGDAFPLCCWTTEPDGHSQSLPKGIHQNNSTLFADVWRQIHYRYFRQSAKPFVIHR